MLLRVKNSPSQVALLMIGIGAVMAGAGSLAEGADLKFSREELEFYEKKIQPILADNCYKCHSHQAEKIKGSFVLDSREALLKGGDTGAAIVPGEPEKSP